MKFTTINLGENKIEIFNSFLGRETIKVNGEVVSRKFSVFGTEHTFIVQENGEAVELKINIGWGFEGIVFDLYRNNQPVVESSKNGCLFFIVIFLIVLAYGLIKDFVL